MKYHYKKITNIIGQTMEVKYQLKDLPVNTPIWGFAYSINDDTTCSRLKCLPVLGEIKPNERYENRSKFYPYKTNTTELNTSKSVYFQNRMYADTYEEAVEMYNELVKKRINKLTSELENAKNDIIEVK